MSENLEASLTAALGSEPVQMRQLSGGDVAIAYRCDLDDGSTVFAKTHADPPPGFFSTEAAGLEWLREPGALPVPEVLAVSDDPPFLVLEWVEEALGAAPDDQPFGASLAGLHAAGAPSFGREDRRTTGSRGLPNDPCDTWTEFYATRRLLPLVRLAQEAAALDATALTEIEQVAAQVGELTGPEEPPARLHGDLWAGNRLVDRRGRSWLIDPAAFGGHREFDLAMMRLFGGFGEACFAAYGERLPLADGWERRVPLYQLAPLVVHAIKFGGGYVGAVSAALGQLR